MALLNFKRREEPGEKHLNPQVEAFLQDYSIEVMPRTAEKIDSFRDLLPDGTRVYIAHIEGTPIEDMVATAKRLATDGYAVMPHFPARIIKDHFTLLTRRRIPEIARKMNLDLDTIQKAVEEIAGLDPAPGRRFSEDTNRVVNPDVIVEKVTMVDSK